MIASPCGTCIFFDKDKIKCEHSQFFISTPKCAYSPGFCRYWRSHKWSEQNNNLSLPQLKEKAINESKLNYDLLVIHNNDDHIEALENLIYSLCPALSSSNVCKRIIIADTTNKKDRTQIIGLFKKYKGPKKLDILVTGEEEKTANTIKRVSRLIEANYFVVIPSNKILSGIDNSVMIDEINSKDTRFLFWPFKMKLAQTEILQLQPVWGLYIKPSYDQLTRLTETPKTFYERLKEEELSTGISLCYPLDVVI